jgi:hypothetical protein
MTSRVWAATEYCGAAVIFFAGLLAVDLTGCASNSPIAISNPPGSPVNVTGNWEFTANPSGGGGVPFGVYLTSANGVVSGSAQVQIAFPQDCVAGCCGGPFAEFNDALTGTADAEGNLTLGSAVPNGGPVFAMTGTVNSGTLTNGSFTLTGGCPAQGTIAGIEYPALNGTYAGTLTSEMTGRSFTIMATLDQSSTPNSGGAFNVSGTAGLTGYPCATSGTVGTPLDQYSSFLGNNLEVTMNAVPSGSLSLSGTLSPDEKTMAAQYAFVLMGSSCNDDYGSGTLTLQ